MNETPVKAKPEHLLKVLAGQGTPASDELKQLITALDNHRVLAKVFLLEGTPFVFQHSPMKYVVFREQVADRFEIGSQDVCIVGSAKLGYSPSPRKFGLPFASSSDVDVVLISEPLFHRGSHALFGALKEMMPDSVSLRTAAMDPKGLCSVDARSLVTVKDSIRNFVYQNFNPGNLPSDHPLRIEIFENMASTSGVFLALEPQVFVSKIRCRVFRTWKAAEDYYSNSLREAKFAFLSHVQPEFGLDDEENAPGEDDPFASLTETVQPSPSVARIPVPPPPKTMAPSFRKA